MKNFHTTFLGSIIPVFLLGFACNAGADILVKYDFIAASPVPSLSGSGVTTQNFTYANGGDEGGGSSTDIGFSTSGNAYLRTDSTGSTEAAALADDDYFSFTISATSPGDLLNLTSLDFDFGGSNLSNNPAYNATIYVQSSVGGFGTGNPVLFTDTHTIPYSVTTFSSSPGSLDLSGMADISTITFQFRFADTITTSGVANRLDNVVLTGTVIPEPGTFMLLLGSITAFGLMCRRRS